MKTFLSTLPLLLCLACLVPSPGPSDAGPTTDVATSSDAPETAQDAPEAVPTCHPVDECPTGWSWTPCGCATDNPDLDRPRDLE